MAVGRPTDYNDTLVEKAREYLTNLPNDEKIHSIEGLADYINISRSNIYLWASQEDKIAFSDIVENIREKQGKRLINGGLGGDFNPSITKVMLTKHGYREGTDVTTDGKALPTPIMPIQNVLPDNSNNKDSSTEEED